MTFKRPRLRADRRLVNAVGAVGLIFLAACGAPSSNVETDTPVPETRVFSDSLALPVVWGTQPLPDAVTDIAFSGGSSPVLAVVFDTGALQLFDLNGDALIEPGGLPIQAIAAGNTVSVDGTPLTLFPVIRENGTLAVSAYNAALEAPLDLPLIDDVNTLGLCASVSDGDGAVFNLGYWTATEPEILIEGTVDIDGTDLSFTEVERTKADDPITGCYVDAGGVLTMSPTGVTVFVLPTETSAVPLALENGVLSVFQGSEITLRDGISITAPSPINAASALSDVRFGGYPDGVIAVAGRTRPGLDQVVFVEPGGLTTANLD